MILDDILKHKREEVEELKRCLPLSKLIQAIEADKESRRSLRLALSQNKKINLICELKKASPSEGILRERFEPKTLAQEFEEAGASAISILTEKHYFKGDSNFLRLIRPITTIPLLRKDFIFDPYQVYETANLGADAFLMIAMLFTKNELKELLILARKLKLDALVEVHSKEELNMVLEVGGDIIGINNRNLKTLQIDHSVSETLFRLIPKGIITVIESGIETRDEISHFQALGANCFLLGTALMKADNVKQKILELQGKN